MGEREGIVVEVRPFDLHGVTYYDLTIADPSGIVDHARVGPESVPADLAAGETVLVMRIANMVVSVRRRPTGP
jgi:hypothetical protein